jgi:calpain family cysteine protease
MDREGIEDLTGGVASYIRSENVLDKDQLWDELKQVNDKFLFGCGTRKGRDNDSADDEGFVRGHAYTVLDAREIVVPPREEKKKKKNKKEEEDKLKTKDGKVRLLKLHNPWGNQEWNGSWSDGSKEWTPEIMKELGHTMGDDGTFFISYQDFLKFYPVIDRIRLIGPEWTVTQQWTAVNVPWRVDYLDTSFKINVTKRGPVVLVLSQPDTRYFRGLQGRYKFSLHFRLYKEGEDTYLLRSMEQSGNMRSCNAETELEPGTYELLLKITAERFDEKKTPEQVIRESKYDIREKLLAVGKSFDLAHSKGKLRELEKANTTRSSRESLEKNRRGWARSRERKRRERARDKLKRKRVVDEIEKKKEEKKKRDEERKKQEEEENKKKGKNTKEHPVNCNCRHGEEIHNKDSFPDEIPVDPISGEADNGNSSVPDGILTPEPSSPSITQPKSKDIEEPTEEANITGESDTLPPKEVVVFEPSKPKTSSEGTESKAEDQSPSADEPTDDTPKDRVDPAKYKAEHEDSAELRSPPRAPPNMPPHPRRQEIIVVDHNQGRPARIPQPPGRYMGPMRGRSVSGSRSRSISPISSVCEDDFPWDDAIDGPPSPLSGDSESDTNSADEMYANDPWQAVCVIGLRVCSLDENARIEIVKGVGRGRRKRGEISAGRARSPA